MIRNIFGALLAVCAFSTLHAAEEELYIGFGVGQYDSEASDGSGTVTGDTQYLEVTAGVQITEVTSVEVFYQHLLEYSTGGNHASASGKKVSGNASNISLVFEKSLDERISLLARSYLQLSDAKIEGVGSESGSDLGFGFGISYKVGEEQNKSLRLEYRSTDPGSSGDETFIHVGIVSYFD